ncbi:Putative_zinc finger in N-recognin (UBR box) and ring finger domain-containing protein [Hexamita inflata]|uniref:E3 ubiquitin-protein ligase n=1 Tax=Hexamita inflata TaxID=28002 RepID=A0AA86TYJ2_9EUKA|nr:Putative zinc finger in N-recognin (UBR box) and ring finger domain-containing protein [Hexamita inflata]
MITKYYNSLVKRIPNFKLISQFVMQQEIVQKQICNQVIQQNNLMFSCQTCSTNFMASYCAQCFIKGDHVDHSWDAIVGEVGKCGCGDNQQFLENGCSSHKHDHHKIISCSDGLEAVLEEMWFFLNQEQHQQEIIDLIADFEALTRIAAVLFLISDEEITLKQLIEMLISNDYSIFFDQYRQIVCQSLFSKHIERKSQIFSAISSDQFFRTYGMRQLGLLVDQILKSKNQSAIATVGKIMQDQHALYLAGKWGSFDQIMKGIQKLFVGKKIQNPEQMEVTIAKIRAFQNDPYQNLFSNQLAGVHSIVHQSTLLSELQKFQYLVTKAYSLQPNQKYKNGNLITKNYTMCSDLLSQLCLPNYQIFSLLNLTKVEPTDVKILFNSVHEQNIPTELFTVNNLDFHVQQIVILLKSAFELDQNSSDEIFNYVPICIPQLYLCNVAKIHNLQVNVIMNKVQLSFRDLSLIELLKKMIRPIITTLKWHILIKQGKIYKQNIEDFIEVKDIIEQQFNCYLLKYQLIFVLQSLLPLIEDWFEYIDELFTNDEEAIIHLISEVIFIPAGTNCLDFQKYVLTSLYQENNLNYKEIQQSGFVQILTHSQINQICSELFTTQIVEPLKDEKLILQTFKYVEPMMYFDIEEYYQQQAILPERVTNGLSSTNKVCASMFTCQPMQLLCQNLVAKFKKGNVPLSCCISALRLLDCFQVDTHLIIKFLNNQKLFELYKVSQDENNNEINAAKRKMMLFQNRKQGQQQNQHLLQTENELNNQQEPDNQCVICHMPLDECCYIPMQITKYVNSVNKIYHIPECEYIEEKYQTCPHKYHYNCILKQTQSSNVKQCSVCKMNFQQILMQITVPKLCDFDLSNHEQPLTKNIPKPQNHTPAYKVIYFHIGLIQQLLTLNEIDITQNYFIELLNNIVSLVKSFISLIKIYQDFNADDLQKLSKLPAFNVFQQYILKQINLKQFLCHLNQLFPNKTSFFSQKLYQNSHTLFKDLLANKFKCYCKIDIDVNHSQDIVQCIQCGCLLHHQCIVTSDDIILCPMCSSNQGLLFLKLNIIAKSMTKSYEGMYQTKHGLNQMSFFGEELFLNQKHLNYLCFQLATQSLNANFTNIQEICQIFCEIPCKQNGQLFTDNQDQDLKRLVIENKITEEEAIIIINAINGEYE